MWLTNLEIGATQLHSVTEIAPKSQLFLFVNRNPIWYGVRTGGAKETRFLWTYIVRKYIFWKNAVIICAKVTFHWFSSINNDLNSLKPTLPPKCRYSVVKKAILYCTQNMKYSSDNTPTIYFYALPWKLKKEWQEKKRPTWLLESFLPFHLDHWHEWFHTGFVRTKWSWQFPYFHISFFGCFLLLSLFAFLINFVLFRIT